MTKKEQELKAPKGNRITGYSASATRYIQLNEFLLFDPLYREMKDKAKILYAFLKKKTVDNKDRTEKFEAGEEGFTKSYRDENGEIYVIADNSELSIILQCHPNRVKDQKDELKLYGLMDEVPQFQTASHLYLLTPQEDQLTERWQYIEEIKELRHKTQEENKKKAEKSKEKKAQKKEETHNSQNVSYEIHENDNSQNVSYDNSQNVSYNNSQIVSKNQSKSFKSTLESFKPTLNLSIQESGLKDALKKTLEDRIDRLIEYKIKVSDIENHFNAVEEIYWISEYNYVLACLLDQMTEKPKNFGAVMNNWLLRNRSEFNNIPPKQNRSDKLVRTESLPDWFYETEEERNKPKTNQLKEDEAKKAKIKESLAAFRKDEKTLGAS